eukprot:CAMPEP_0119020588 /NCGR_PEP_ID=MMETSP1176-20130426/24371_1 /TAXON_ID=265551 /ORGANISM="Synedropsis recta cf, Strain CCMP1620" /LENGTH=200 /DNA_ID=CAMNT_0006975039 /DNA_START=129 /DNA_END=727 /DNA_ORIENTATION=-
MMNCNSFNQVSQMPMEQHRAAMPFGNVSATQNELLSTVAIFDRKNSSAVAPPAERSWRSPTGHLHSSDRPAFDRCRRRRRLAHQKRRISQHPQQRGRRATSQDYQGNSASPQPSNIISAVVSALNVVLADDDAPNDYTNNIVDEASTEYIVEEWIRSWRRNRHQRSTSEFQEPPTTTTGFQYEQEPNEGAFINGLLLFAP